METKYFVEDSYFRQWNKGQSDAEKLSVKLKEGWRGTFHEILGKEIFPSGIMGLTWGIYTNFSLTVSSITIFRSMKCLQNKIGTGTVSNHSRQMTLKAI